MKYLSALALLAALLFSTACTQSPEKLVATGNRWHDKKKYTEASILYQKAITKNKTYAEAYYRQGINLMDQNDWVNASKYLRRAVDLKPDNVDAASRLAQIYLTFYGTNPKRLQSLLPEVKELDSKILSRNPNSFEGLKIEALLQLAQGDRDKALETFAKANQVKPNSPDLTYFYAETLIAAGQQQQGEDLLRATLAQNPKWGSGYDLLFILYTRAKDAPKAEAVLRERVQKDPTNEVALQNLANYLATTGRYNEAESTIKRALDNKTAFPNGHLLVGDFYLRSKKFDQALQQYQEGVNDDPKDATRYQQRMVSVYDSTGHRDEALKLAKSLTEKDPKNTGLSDMYAALLLQTPSTNEVSNSLSQLQALVQKNPADPALHFELARAYLDTNQRNKALEEALNAMQNEAKTRAPRPGVIIGSRLIAARVYEDRGDHAKAMEQVSVILQAQPNNPDARLLKDRALIGENEVAQAQPDLEALAQQFPKMTDAHLQLGALYAGEKEFDKAMAQFQQVAAANPKDLRGFLGEQTVKMAEGKGNEAVQALQDLVQKNPNALPFRYQLASFESTYGAELARTDPTHAKQLFQQAADNYKQILKTTTNSADVWLRLGILQEALGDYDAALASFEQGSNADPHNPNTVLQRAMLLEKLGKTKDAAAAYNRVIGIDPENALALNNLAFLNAETGSNLDQALTFAQRAKKRLPSSPDVSDTLGYVYYQKNLNSEAVQIFRQIVQQVPQSATFRLHLAMALQKQGDKQGAKDEAEKALKNATAPDEQNKIRSFLNQLG